MRNINSAAAVEWLLEHEGDGSDSEEAAYGMEHACFDTSAIPDKDIALIVEMGFSRAESIEALCTARGEVAQAVSICLGR